MYLYAPPTISYPTGHMSRLALIAILLVSFTFIACGEEGPPADPPEGWMDGGDRWWQADVDTALAFRDLRGFHTMGLSNNEGGYFSTEPMVINIQMELLELYRTNPEIADSMFQAVAMPIIRQDAVSGQSDDERREVLRRIMRRYNDILLPPRGLVREQREIVIPDSLKGIGGVVRFQIRLDEEGVAQAAKVVTGVHPVIDRIIMRNFVDRLWQPALYGPQRTPISSWVHSAVQIPE